MEIEVKVPVENLDEIAKKAEKLGYEPVEPRHFEANVLYDYPDRSLSLAGCLLRVRDLGDKALFTFKGKAVAHDRYKVRPEDEVICSDGEKLMEILENIGFRASYRYEKYRKEYRTPDAFLCLDEVPFGFFLELEGTPESIENLAKALELDPSTFIRRSYADLYGEYCRKYGKSFGDMIFERDDENK